MIFGVGHTSPAKLFRPDFSAKKKNVVQPTKIVCTLKISWNKIFVWLPIAFPFGSESWEEQLKTPCMTVYLEALLRQMNDSINAVAGTKTSGSIDGL